MVATKPVVTTLGTWTSSQCRSTPTRRLRQPLVQLAHRSARVGHGRTALAVFDHEHAYEGTGLREWAQRLYRPCRYTRMPRGGHVAAVEAPQLVADDLRAFVTELEA